MVKETFFIKTTSAMLITLIFALFFGGCSQNTNPLEVKIENETTGISNLTILPLPQMKTTLQKLIVESEQISVEYGGELDLSSGKDFELIEMINMGPNEISNYDLGQILSLESPLSANVLQTICKNPKLQNDYWMINVLLQNAPLRECVLNTIIDNGFIKKSYYLKEVLIASSPLPESVLNKLKKVRLTRYERQLVLDAQIGDRNDEYLYNNAGGGVKINLKVLPYSISRDANISIATDDEYLLGDVYLTFGPNGISFNPPAILNFEISGLNLSGIDPDLIDIFYINPDTHLWELMPRKSIIVNAETGYINVVDAEFSHFSRYAIGMQ